MVRKLHGIECRLVEDIFLPALTKKSVGDGVRWGGGGGAVMVLLSGILKFHLYTLLERGRNCFFFFMSGKHLTTMDFCTTRGK